VKSKKGAATREKILDAAQGMVLERGYSGVSIDKLIESLGVTKGAFFHHFKNKKELTEDEETAVKGSIWLMTPENICVKCHNLQSHKSHEKYDKD